MRSGLTPAPEPGSRRDSHAPAGVIARTDSTKSSMCVHTVAKCPAARVAIQPPSVEYSNDCGKWRSVSPCSPSCASSARAGRARLDARRARDGVDLEHAVERAQVDRDRAVVGVGHVGRHAADDRRAAAEGDRRDALAAAPLEQPLDVGLLARARDEVGRMLEAPAKAADDVE